LSNNQIELLLLWSSKTNIETFHHLSPLRFEKEVFSDSVNRQQNRRREVCTKLTFIQANVTTFAECVSQGLLQTLKTFKAVKDITFVLYRLHDDPKALKGLENCFTARFPSLNRIQFSISNECDYPRSELETTFESLNTLIKILRKRISLDKISIHLNLCNTLDSTVSSTTKRLFSALKRFPALNKLHLNIYSDCLHQQHIPCDNEYIESVSEFLNKKTHLKDLELNLSTGSEIPDKLFKAFLTSLEQLNFLQRFKLHLIAGERAMTDSKLKKLCPLLKKLKSLQTLDFNFHG